MTDAHLPDPILPPEPTALAAAPRFTRAERIADAAVHCTGLALAVLAAPVLVTLCAVFYGAGKEIAGVSIYVAGMLLMLGCSAAYHMIPTTAWREVLRRMDHAAIYLKIAATQTPFAVLIGGSGAPWLLGTVWTAALGGAAAKLFWPERMGRLALPLYLALGWAGAALFWPAADGEALAFATSVLVVVGGLLYTIGVGFFLAERLRFHNAIWHSFVLVATFVFYSAVMAEIGLRAAASAPA